MFFLPKITATKIKLKGQLTHNTKKENLPGIPNLPGFGI